MKYDAAINLALDAHELLVRKAAAFDALTTRVPLTSAQIAEIWRNCPQSIDSMIHAVEAHHGIGVTE